MAHRLTTGPSLQVLLADEAKQQCRIDLSEDDAYVNGLIQRATKHCENITKRQFISATWTLSLDSFYDPRYVTCGRIFVPRPPLIAVSSIAYIATDGTTTTLDASDYRVDAQSQPGRIEPAYGESWPVTRDVVNAVTVTHTAGYGTGASSVPEDIKHAILLLVGHWFYNREAAGTMTKEIESGVTNLLDPYVMEQYA